MPRSSGFSRWARLSASARSARIHLPRIGVERAKLARLVGDEAGRERHLREAHRLYTEMGATGHAERVAKELGL